MLRRLTSLLLALTMVLTMVPVSALAEETKETQAEETVVQTTESAEETTEAAEETTAPSEEMTAPSEESTQEIEAPSEPEPETEQVGTVSKEAMLSGTEIASGTCGDNLTWVLDSEGTLTISGTGAMTNYNYGEEMPGYFNRYYSSIKHVTIDYGVTSIGDCAFWACVLMTDVTIPDSITSIGDSAFYDSRSLTSVTIPDSVTSIGDSAFENCVSLTSVTIPDSVTSIGLCAFRSCESLTSVKIPDNVTSIGDYAFYCCYRLSSVTIPDSVTSIGDYAFYCCYRLTSVTIPDNVTSIGKGAFWSCSSLTSVTIPDNVTSIGDYVFAHCSSLTSVTIPDNVTSIGEAAFDNCSSLTSVTIPDSVIWIGSYAFSGCSSLDGIWVGSANTAYSSDDWGVLFDKGKSVLIQAPGAITGSYPIPDSVTSIGHGAFASCGSLTGVTIPDSVTSIGAWAFSSCHSLTSVTIPDRVTSIDESTFSNCSSLTSVTIPDSITSIDREAFYCCRSLTGVTIPDRVTSIFESTFSGCSSLTSVTIPAGVTSIGDWAFSECSSLTSIYFEGNAPSFGGRVFQVTTSATTTPTAYYPSGNATWTEDIMRYDHGRILIWVPYTPGAGAPEAPPIYHDTLDTLEEADYMAFSAIAYKDFSGQTGKTVEQVLVEQGVWDTWFSKEQDITYADLCKYISQWKVRLDMDFSDVHGFYAVAFENGNKEIVAAYRGSTSYTEMLTSVDGAQDWLVNDIPTQVFNIVFADKNQYELGFYFLESILNLGYDLSSIVATGHSLGGGMGDIVSARYGCKAVTMNAICIMDAIYDYAPMEMGINFEGIDRWNFVDHTSEEDFWAGMFEANFGTQVKPYIAHKTIKSESHSLNSYAEKDSSGNVVLTERTGEFNPIQQISKMQSVATALDLGTSGENIFNKGVALPASRTSFGGNSSDKIYASILNDTLIGGDGGDILDGGWGNDIYYYFKGDGCDTIMDAGGQDRLYLEGFDENDLIEMHEDADSDYILISCNGSTIVQIYKKNRDYSAVTLSSFKVYINGGRENNITKYFNEHRAGSHVLVQCPVNIEILDAQQNVVYTLKDGDEGSFYTEYGNFYVFEEENGGFCKALDLAENYTVRIVGYDDGTMKIDYREVVDGELTEPRNFVDVPVSALFGATFEETDDGELVLAADTDGDGTVDTKIGYDGQPVPPEEITIDREYVVLKPGETVRLTADVQPSALENIVRWSMEEGSETVASVDESGLVTALDAGTGYVLVSVQSGESEIAARCRVDVAETETVDEEEQIILDGIQLSTTRLTSELYSTDYAQFDLLLKLPQNMNFQSAGESAIPEINSVAIEDVYFTASTAKVAFDLVALDDRRIAVVPTEYALEYPEELAKTYKSKVTVVVQGEEYTTEEELTLTLKQTRPKLKATISAFNSFYTGQTQEITVTGGTVSGITAKTLPDWLTLNADGTLSLNENEAQKSGNAVLLVETEEWRIPAEITLAVKNSYKAPGLKLSASSVKMSSDSANSSGAELKLLPKNKKDSYAAMNVNGITSQTEGYRVTNFDAASGTFTLKAESGFQPGKVTLNVSFSDTDEVLPLTVKVAVQTVSLKLSAKTVTLNAATGDSARVKLTAAPADYVITDPVISGNEAGELDISCANNILTVSINGTTQANTTYTLNISAGDSKPVKLTVKTVDAVPAFTLKATGNIDLSFPDKAAAVTATVKNYASGNTSDFVYTVIAPDGIASDDFTVTRNGTVFTINCNNTDIPTGVYTLALKLLLPDGTGVENAVTLMVKRTAVKLKLSPAKLILNSTIADKANVAVTGATKGYDFTQPIWELKAKNGKDSAEGALDISWDSGKLTIAVNDNTEPGATYKLLVKANAYAPAATLTVTIPTEVKSAIKSSLKAKGAIDVIREGTSVVLTPGYKNATAAGEEILNIYSSADNYTEPVNDLFNIEKDDIGRYILTAADGLDHSRTYKAELVTMFGSTEVKSALTKFTVKMGSAKLTLNADGNILFGNDCRSRVGFTFSARDAALNAVQEVTVKADRKGYDQMLEVIDLGGGEFAIGFKDETVHRSLLGKTITVTLNIKLQGNETEKVNTTAKLKLTVLP